MECGAQIAPTKSGPAGVFSMLITVMFYVSLGGIGVALFSEKGPPLMVAVLVTCALGFLKKSAGDGLQQAIKRH